MPLGKTVANSAPPKEETKSGSYGPLYQALYDTQPDQWCAIDIEHPADQEGKTREIANVRRAAQRWFALGENVNTFHMVSLVTEQSETLSTMFIKKEARIRKKTMQGSELEKQIDELLG